LGGCRRQACRATCSLRPGPRHRHRGRAVGAGGRRCDPSRPGLGRDLAPAPVRRRDEPYGHGRRRLHEPGLRLRSRTVRKVYYNITVTSLSLALAIGTIELLQAAAKKFGLDSGFWALLNNLDFGMLGYGIVGLFVLTWAFSLLI
jgi:hypothetical protein